ncbi:microtubule-associated protein futsch-like [Brachionichthys hirsutus]|uniref:microtubule-associated protein futsch-like n=1 Tax=Brachionichthys hirsutus TaxID=412623 RepID=UPI003604F194
MGDVVGSRRIPQTPVCLSAKMNETGPHRIPPDQSLGSGHSFGTPRHPSIIEPILSKRVCFYKSGDPQFGGLRMVINNRTFKTFDALLDSLSKKVPLPFGVRNITTPRGVHAIHALNELEDGKSYICSDTRKVKPINLAHARKKLPPWYHARPVSARRWTVQEAKFFPGQNLHKKEWAVVRVPKRLQVFCNGNPNVKYSVMTRKRTTPTFESVLGYISELIQVHVVKLHTTDGKRVDGLPGLILCSGIVVAAGREPFRPANYNVEKSPVPATLPTNQSSLRRRKAFNRKKKPPSYTSQSRRFSASSERYIVNRIHDSIAESSCDLPSIPTNSVELESGRVLQSVVETGDDACLSDGAGGQGGLLPSEDDIEKSFRVNQDGSMTVEMRVRLTIKEEETVQWTTTLSRSSVTSQLNGEPVEEPEILSMKSNLMDLKSPTASINTNEDKTEDDNDEDPSSLGNGAFSESSNEEDNIKDQTSMVLQRRAPTPGHKLVRRKQTSVESVTSVMAEGVQEDMIGSYSYSQQMENGAVTKQYCMVKQSSTMPVPKPRRLDSMNGESRTLSTVKSAEMLQSESSGEEVTETVLHIYEQQMCQDSYLANLRAQGSPVPGIPLTKRGERLSATSNSTLPTFKTDGTNDQQQPPNVIQGKDRPQEREVNEVKRVSAKAKASNKRVPQLVSPRRRQKENPTKATTKNKKITFSSAGFIKKIYGTKSKSVKSTKKKLKKRPALRGNEDVTTKSSQKLDETTKHIIKAPELQSALKEKPREAISYEKNMHNGADNIASQHEYVESWLEKSHLNQESKVKEEIKQVQTENCSYGESENKNSSMEETSEKQRSLTSGLLAENVRRASVKQRVQSFENKSSNQSMEKIAINQPINNHVAKKNCARLAQNHIEEDRPLSNCSCSEMTLRNKTSTEMLPGRDDKSRQVKDLLNSLSTELPPPPPPPAEDIELPGSEHSMMDASSAASSPLYRLSSTSSQGSDNHPLAVIPAPDPAISPTDRTVPMTTSIHDSPLHRTPSIKRVPLVSNGSLDRKMSLRKARVDKYALCSNAAVETTTSQTAITVVGDNVRLDCPTRTQLPSETRSEGSSLKDVKSSPSCCSSADAASLTSEGRMSSASVSSSEATTPNNLPSREAPNVNHSSQTKPMFNKPKLQKTPSPYAQSLDMASPPARHLKASKVSCAEALKMIKSLREISSIEDSHNLKVSLSNLQRSASKQLLQCWSGFQEIEPEGNRVRSIREMFLAKSATDIQYGCFPSPNKAELSEQRAETSISGGYQSQTSSDLSGGEDDPARKTITKGFVRRTIERLYGKKDANPDEDGAGINKAFPTFPQGEGMHGSTEIPPHSLFSTKAEQEDKSKSSSSKCTYFSLPHANSDSEVCQEGLNTVIKSSMNGDIIAETKTEDTKTRAERNGKLPGVSITDFKMMDNKVHPMMEPPPDDRVVVAQPVRGQGPLNRRLQEPDMLDLLYDFCGQNCPIL